MSQSKNLATFTFQPLTADRWKDFEQLFGENGAYGGCWCMFWRTTRAEFARNGNAGNKQAMANLVQSGVVPGIIAYRDGRPVGWCSVAPRDDFASLNRSRVLKRLDDTPVWSIVCFFVPRDVRGQGVLAALVRGAVEYVRAQGGEVVEAYPPDRGDDAFDAAASYMGLPDVFRQAGFIEVARPSDKRLIMRYTIE